VVPADLLRLAFGLKFRGLPIWHFRDHHLSESRCQKIEGSPASPVQPRI